MFPILYEQITPGVVPQNNGLGVLSDCISCECEQKRNGIYELVFEYPMNGIHAQDIALRRVVKVKPNPTDAPQLFRIKRIGKEMNGSFAVYCKHISYDLSGCEITSGTATSATGACLVLQNAASGYTITTDKQVTADFVVDVPASVRSYFAGKAGSFLDVYGTAEIKYDNFNVQFLTHAGENRGAEIRYAKNLLELSQEIDADNLYTHVICFYKSEGTKVLSDKVATGLTLDAPATLLIDCSNDYDQAPTVADLTARATQYINAHNLTTPTNNIKLDFVQSGELTNRVDLCDTVSIYYEALGITRANVKCIRTKYDCIREKYIETEFGDVKADLTDTFTAVIKEVGEKPSTSTMETAIRKATELITGNLGGFVVLHDTDNDGEPNEILIMNTNDITTATKVWRWNENGLGYSSTGYAGNYSLAMTADGEIVADFIKVGTLNANLIKAGTISDVNGNSTIDLQTGIAKLFQLIAKRDLSVIDANNVVKAYLSTLQGGGIALRLLDSAGTGNVVRLESDGQNPYFELKGNEAYQQLINASQKVRIFFWIGGNDDGIIAVYDNNDTQTISLTGTDGRIKCGHVEQTAGCVTLFDGDEYTEKRVPWGNYNMFVIYGRLSATGSLIPMVIPTAMITTSAQKFIINDETHYATYNVWHDDQTDELVVRWNTSSQTAQRLNKIYGIY